ncbi:MFS general substrate transporter [Sistotremastrum niveocremeum HHB9708]|uniref:Lysosomal dipeptide transporter MFSD1 n=1 Tax=Sistotremastrum niveocremeum HHB9708 TaxID=1314777 RepID=A0A164Q6G3_9AGAM|nr:MFS general substrate transporter [Sistotremastrum niveocremeum HHB9708]
MSDHDVTKEDLKESLSYSSGGRSSPVRRTLPIPWRLLMILLTCLCSFGNHWSNALIVSLKTTILKEMHINNTQFATLVAVTNLANTILCVLIGLAIDKFGGAYLSVILAFFHLAGATIMAGAATNGLNSYNVLIVGKVLAAIGDGSLDNAQHRIFATYFSRGKGFAFSIGAIWSVANLGQFAGQSTANLITVNLGSYAWALWISASIALFSLLCAGGVVILDRYLRTHYDIVDQTDGKQHVGKHQSGIFSLKAIKNLPATFWIVVLFAIFENAGVQSFVSISTQFAQQRLKKGAVIGGWVSSMYLLLPICLTPFLGVFIDVYGQRVTFLFISGTSFLISMLLLKFARGVPTFVAAYVFYALAQAVTPAPQVEIVRSVIPDARLFGTAFAIKKSVVQASIVIITTAAGKVQDEAGGDLNPALTLWVVYAFISVAISGALLFGSQIARRLLPAARLSQVPPRHLIAEIQKLEGFSDDESENPMGFFGPELTENMANRERDLKAPKPHRFMGWIMLGLCVGIIVLGWVLFGLGVAWGVHGSVIAGTTGE